MAQVTVTIAGRIYRMACDDGEEPHLESMARAVEEKIAEMRANFGEIGDQRLVVMSAIAFADQLAEAQGKLAAAQAEIERAGAETKAGRDRTGAWVDGLTVELDRAADRVERLAKDLNAVGKE